MARDAEQLCDKCCFDRRTALLRPHPITIAQRKAVSARDRHCVAEGCTRPSAFCDVHHLDHRASGGETAVDNLALLCRRHHVLLHRGTGGRHDLYTPWLPEPEPIGRDPWRQQSPPLVA